MSDIISAALDQQAEREEAAREAAKPENWPLIDAATLFRRRGCDCVADVALADGTLPVNGQWRMDRAEWNLYRGLCQAAALRCVQRQQEIEREGCAS